MYKLALDLLEMTKFLSSRCKQSGIDVDEIEVCLIHMKYVSDRVSVTDGCLDLPNELVIKCISLTCAFLSIFCGTINKIVVFVFCINF